MRQSFEYSLSNLLTNLLAIGVGLVIPVFALSCFCLRTFISVLPLGGVTVETGKTIKQR